MKVILLRPEMSESSMSSENQSTEITNEEASTAKSYRPVWFLVGLAFVSGLIVWKSFGIDANSAVNQTSVETSKQTQIEEKNSPSATENSQDDEYRKQILGTWTQQEKEGKRTLVLEEGGKGTLTVEIESFLALLLGKKIELKIDWTVKQGRAIFTSLSGEPAAAFEYVKKNYGTVRDRKIAQLDGEKLIFLDDLKDGSKSSWERLED